MNIRSCSIDRVNVEIQLIDMIFFGTNGFIIKNFVPCFHVSQTCFTWFGSPVLFDHSILQRLVKLNIYYGIVTCVHLRLSFSVHCGRAKPTAVIYNKNPENMDHYATVHA